MPRRMVFDRWLFFTVALLAVGGLLIVGSASNYVAMRYGSNASAFYLKHLVNLLVGTLAMVGALYLPYERLSKRTWALGLVGLAGVLLVVVLAMPAAGGAHRWIPLGPYFKLQPSELAKVFTVVFMAYMLARKEREVNETWRVPVQTR